MITNLKTLKLIRTGDNGLRIAMTRKTPESGIVPDDSATHYIITRDEFPQIENIVAGNEKYSPYFDDGLYLLKFYPSGIRCVNTDGRKDVHDYFTFPAREIIPYLDRLFNDANFNRPGMEIDLTESLYNWDRKYRPQVKINYQESSYEGFYVSSKLESDQQRDDVTNKPLDLIARLTGIAESYSDGNLITVNVSFDECPSNDRPTSYYWSITDEQNRLIYNGGFLAHGNHQAPETFEYSIHT